MYKSKLEFEKLDDNSYIFIFNKKSKYKYIVPNKIKTQIDKITDIFQVSIFWLGIALVRINLLLLLSLFVSIPVWFLVLKYLLRNCEKALIKKP